jgi:chromosome segregation protein
LQRQETELEKNIYKITEELKHAHRLHDIAQLEQEQLMGEEFDLDEEIQNYGQVIEKIAQEIADAQASVTSSTREIDSLASQLKSYEETVMDLKLRKTSLSAQLDNSQNTARRLQAFQQDSQKQLEELSQEIQRKSLRHEQSQTQIGEKAVKLDELNQTLSDLDASLDMHEREYATIDQRLKANDEKIAEIQDHREQVIQKTRMVELEQSQQLIKREGIENRLSEYHHQSVAELRRNFREPYQKLNKTTEQLKKELANLKEKSVKMGDINLGAIHEYEELSQRYEFLQTQQEDLNQAIADLEKVIRKINRISQKKFMETYELINEKLGEVFPRLFNGGAAQLVLTEPTKPLETGIELMIHLPGKKLTRLSLLSGGEKALSAIAFIFAIFLIKPASFCLLDEIDAPLDEANVMRFNELLQIIGEKSQIVMVTHNKKSMEFAETLFGVTMEKKGISKLVSVHLATSSEDVYPNAA